METLIWRGESKERFFLRLFLCIFIPGVGHSEGIFEALKWMGLEGLGLGIRFLLLISLGYGLCFVML